MIAKNVEPSNKEVRGMKEPQKAIDEWIDKKYAEIRAKRGE